MEYYVARVVIDREECFTVAKFDGSDVPERVYTMSTKNDKLNCDCPSPHRPCKHAKLVQYWLEQGEPPSAMAMPFAKEPARTGPGKRYRVTL